VAETGIKVIRENSAVAPNVDFERTSRAADQDQPAIFVAATVE
jgi:hypothetical protein